jgi:hypothetical protein
VDIAVVELRLDVRRDGRKRMQPSIRYRDRTSMRRPQPRKFVFVKMCVAVFRGGVRCTGWTAQCPIAVGGLLTILPGTLGREMSPG